MGSNHPRSSLCCHRPLDASQPALLERAGAATAAIALGLAGGGAVAANLLTTATPAGAVYSADIDNDGIPNGIDDDVDGDGVDDSVDADEDGDGVENESDDDTDGDGVDNVEDSHANGDDD